MATDFLNSKVLSVIDEHRISILRILTDNGRKYCSDPINDDFQLFMYLNDVEHTRARVKTPKTNGALEKLNQIIQEESYSIVFRKKFYTDLEELQKHLDEYIKTYNFERTNQGKRCKGRTPFETFSERILRHKRMVYDKREEEKVLQ